MKSALTIAGFDPSGGAGIQADLKVFHSCGVYGLSVVSALTAQNSGGVRSVMPVSDHFVRKQLTVLLDDMKPDATKTGMLYSEAVVEAVAHIVRRYSLENFVIDPVMLSSTGKHLAEKGVPDAIRKKLLPLCTVVTPNIYEASVLSGVHIQNMSDMEKAAVRISEYGAGNVIITGGHLDKMAMDLVYDGEFHYLKGRKIRGEFHGTGCAFSAAITALLAKGKGVLKAAELAKGFMKTAFKRSFRAGGVMKLFDI
jgi:hydroxymethylpyrimidine/phosphomethylpyrimidine kinase